MDAIRIQMMDHFAIYINEQKCEHMINKSRKGLALMQYLILRRGQPVPNYRLLSAFWPDEECANPESALKTLISRVRVQLNQISPGLGKCIVADRGAYHWQCTENMTVDAYEVMDILDIISRGDPAEHDSALYDRLVKLYTGDLLQYSDRNDWVVAEATLLHNRYISAVYSRLDVLEKSENYEEIIRISRSALEVDKFDDRLHMSLMSALIKTDRTGDALVQYKHVMHLHYRYLGVQPSESMQEFYKQIVNAGKALEFSLESICNELMKGGERSGAFICEYAVFKEIFNLQMRNLERLGSTMFLAVIMISDHNGNPMDPMRQSAAMGSLLEIMRTNLRKGDTITQFSPSIFALLLPTVNYATGTQVMERIKRIFYGANPTSNVAFNYRVGPLSSDGNISGGGKIFRNEDFLN